MTYQEAIDFLFSQLPMFSRIGAPAYKPGLDTSIHLDNYFGNPHRKFKSIHIAGTNGKGSVSHNLASILQAQGYKVGLYTSPHLIDFRERMRINGEMIPEEDVVDFVVRWQTSNFDGRPSFFELTMMMAFDWFAKEGVDYAVIEVGMGGRLDSTNIISPIAGVITNISLDHTQFLGDTLLAIAKEKGGIIKAGIPMTIGNVNDEIRALYAKTANDLMSPIKFASDYQYLKNPRINEDFTISGTYNGHEIVSPLSGEYQMENLNTILHVIEMLRFRGFEISEEAVVNGLRDVMKSTGFAGRWMKLSDSPLTICDTGHNRGGLERTMPQLENLLAKRREKYPDARLRIVIGFVNDKDVEHIIDLLPKDAEYYVTQASVPRAMPAESLLHLLENGELKCRLIPEGVAIAYEAALNDSDKEKDILFIGGSTFVVADLLNNLQK
ncbi:MAG: bifunctional folylpolyglutamate synthase/dihydrofolate synthase [Muribaculaceae bacterium]|nr:bifunctional folylpolyglutamate synthase/dihydrofolate synthase [Muribaculaceae bacterium]